MITTRITTGNIFDSRAKALVAPVNCVGIAGAGLALQFAEAFPEWHERYKLLCKPELQEILPGSVHLYWYPRNERCIVSFPTKTHWRDTSYPSFIALGLRDLHHKLCHADIESVAIPKLGCGLGGLEWDVVKEQILSQFDSRTHAGTYLNHLDVTIYE